MCKIKIYFWIVIFFIVLNIKNYSQPYVEIDPIAYVLKGYSLHGGYVFSNSKIDAGVFGLEIPKSFHGNKDFTVSGSGFGLKWHYLGNPTSGLFAGIGSGFMKKTYEANGNKVEKDSFSLGVEIGYRFEFNNIGFYLAPWIGFDHSFGAKNINVGSKNFKEGEISFFPTIHLGWLF